MEDCNLSELLQKYHVKQKKFHELLINIKNSSKNFIQKSNLLNLNEESYNNQLSGAKTQLVNSLDNLANWANNLEDSNIYLEFSSTLQTILNHLVTSFRRNQILSKSN